MPTDRYTATATELRGIADWIEAKRDASGPPSTLLTFLRLASKLRVEAHKAESFANLFDPSEG